MIAVQRAATRSRSFRVAGRTHSGRARSLTLPLLAISIVSRLPSRIRGEPCPPATSGTCRFAHRRARIRLNASRAPNLPRRCARSSGRASRPWRRREKGVDDARLRDATLAQRSRSGNARRFRGEHKSLPSRRRMARPELTKLGKSFPEMRSRLRVRYVSSRRTKKVLAVRLTETRTVRSKLHPVLPGRVAPARLARALRVVLVG